MIGALGTVTKGLLKGLEDLEVGGRVETIQTTALLRTAKILRRVLETLGDLLSLKPQWKNHQLILMWKALEELLIKWQQEKRLSCGENLERFIPRRCTITIAICYHDDATQPHSQEIHRWKQTHEIVGNDQSPNVHGRHKTFCQKRKSIGNPNTGS